MSEVAFDRFYRYEELTHILQDWAERYPRLCKLSSIGRSHEGRDIWLVTVTNFDTGADGDKPALWVDANIHAVEVTGCTAALHLIDKLLTGGDERTRHALDTRTFYVVPRVNPDGPELALAERPRFVRSSTRPYPRTDPVDGLYEEDVDGDGRILFMRVPDPNGAWKVAEEDPRLLVARAPDEVEGRFYRLLPEGRISNFDGWTFEVQPPLENLDLNRNFPMEWATESEQKGAGPFPASEPEVRALVQAIIERPNITGYITYHTFSGVHLRPYSAHDDEHFPPRDLDVFKEIGEHATATTGYPAVSVFHDFKYEAKQSIKGGADDWAYEHLGVFAWTTEFWSPQRQVGLKDYHFIDWLKKHPIEDDLKLLKWSDDVLGGKGFVDWYEFEHPQLGAVELGGWDVMYCWANPPPEFLEAEIARHSDFAVWHGLISPKLELRSLEHERVGEGTVHIQMVVENTGWLPTNVTEKAIERKIVREAEAEIELPADARLLVGKPRLELGQLGGRTGKRSILWWGNDESTKDRAKIEWIVRAPSGGVAVIEVRHQRAGVVRAEVDLSTAG